MTHTTLRPYTKIVSVDAGETSAIQLRDTSETLLECNYIRVNTSGTDIVTGDDSFDFTVYLSGIPNLTTPDTPTTAATAEGSGFCGIAGQGDGINPVEIFLDDQDKVSEIQIYSPANRNYSITYGNIRFINPMRFNDRPKGS
jgi:hypothetical protein